MGQAAMATMAAMDHMATENQQVAERIRAHRVRIPPSPPFYFF